MWKSAQIVECFPVLVKSTLVKKTASCYKIHMEIIRLGHSSFRIKGKQASIVTDPFSSDSVGIKFPKVEARIVTISHNHGDHNYKEGVSGNPVFIEGPGEYEIADVFIRGISTFHDSKNGEERGKNTVYNFYLDNIHLAHLGDLGHTLSDSQMEQLGDVDILFIPVGGLYTIDAEKASEVVAKIEPQIVIPMHYHEERLNQSSFGSLGKLDEFFKEMGKEKTIIPKLVVTKDKLPQELQVVALE